MFTALLICSVFTTDFTEELSAADLAYREVQGSTDSELRVGDMRGAQKRFLDAVPEDERTAAHWFMLGNVWFDLDPAFAYSMHEKAFALAPTEPLVQREWAIELHRAQECGRAEEIYSKLSGANADQDALNAALRADCLLALGRPLEAAKAWVKVKEMVNREHIVHLFSWIYGPSDRYAKRALWLGELREKDLTHAEDLILGDLYWEKQGPYYFVKYEYLEHDLKLLESLLDAKSERALDLRGVADILFIDWEQNFPGGVDSVPRKTVLTHATERNWIGESARLPEHPELARAVIELLLRHEGNPETLLAEHSAELQRRAGLAASDGQAAEVLVLLAEFAQSPKLSEYEDLIPTTPLEMGRQEVQLARQAGRPLVEPLVHSIQAQLRSGHPEPVSLDRDFELLAIEAAR